jgi:5-(carboxyamino)imidazole ribonucleotide synthase
MSKPDGALSPGSSIGILGGGQLGRMLALAAARLGFRTHVYCPEPDAPAAEVATTATVAPYGDTKSLACFAESVAVATFEFENVPARTVETLARQVAIFPNARALAVGQDRVAEKEFATGLGLEAARFAAVDGEAALSQAITQVGLPAILKTRQLGYDGKGQALIRASADAKSAWAKLGGAPAILEALVPFTREISVVLARGKDGATRAYDPAWNIHAGGILRRSIAPAGLDAATEERARAMAAKIAEALDYVGVLAVEIFLVPERRGGPRLLFNELAPRVHNSGHWTLDACAVSQFEQHVRAIAGWPLGAPARHSDAVMDNLIGDEVNTWAARLAEPDAALHLYGKREIRPGRKMGHVTRLYRLGALPADEALEKI